MNIADIANKNTITIKGKTYKNEENMSREMAIFNAYMSDSYDGRQTSKELLSVTDLLIPIRKLLLKIKYPIPEGMVEISKLTSSARGTSMHSGIEAALDWADEGYTQEVRSSKFIDGVEISGKFDIVTPDGMIKDLKNVSNYALKTLREEMTVMDSGLSSEEMAVQFPKFWGYQFQLSAYAWLNPDLITKPYGSILFHLNNGGGFDKLPINSEVQFPLVPKEEIERYITERIKVIKHYLDTDTMPECTEQERGFRPGSWKLTRVGKTGKATTVRGSIFDNYSDFAAFVSAKGKPGDTTVVVEPEDVLCGYCSHREQCGR